MPDIGLIGFPMDLGGNRRGVDMGPSAVRLTDFAERLAALGVSVHDMGNVLVHTRELLEEGDEQARFLDEILRACVACADMTVEAAEAGHVPLVVGGDHTVAMGSMWGMARHHGEPGGVIWIDAHGDLNTPATSPSGNIHGMSLAVALGLTGDDPRFVPDGMPRQSVLPEHSVLIATRDLDAGERQILRQPGAPRAFTMAEIDERGIAAVAQEAVEIVGAAAFVHVTLDLDALDPREAPGVGTPVRGGLSYREAHFLMETLSKSRIDSLDVVEVNPVLDISNSTAEIAGELICSLFGATIV
jgi:arginase